MQDAIDFRKIDSKLYDRRVCMLIIWPVHEIMVLIATASSEGSVESVQIRQGFPYTKYV